MTPFLKAGISRPVVPSNKRGVQVPQLLTQVFRQRGSLWLHRCQLSGVPEAQEPIEDLVKVFLVTSANNLQVFPADGVVNLHLAIDTESPGGYTGLGALTKGSDNVHN